MSPIKKNSRLIFLGTGSLDVFPKPGCNDILCQAARRGGKDRRAQPGLIYNRILIDCGEGIPERIKEWHLENEFDAVLISHPHRDHCWGLQKFSWKKPIYVPLDSREIFDNLFPELKSRFRNYYCLGENEINGEKFKAIRIFHSPAIFNHAFRFNKFVYAQDIGKLDKRFGEFVKNAKLVIGDGFSFDQDFVIQEAYYHVSMIRQINFFVKYQVRSIIFDGIGHHSKVPHEYLELKLWDYVEDNNLKISVHLAYDGLTLGF